jgi:hypothetical protein
MNPTDGFSDDDPQANADEIVEQGQATKVTQGRLSGYLTEFSTWPWRI